MNNSYVIDKLYYYYCATKLYYYCDCYYVLLILYIKCLCKDTCTAGGPVGSS